MKDGEYSASASAALYNEFDDAAEKAIQEIQEHLQRMYSVKDHKASGSENNRYVNAVKYKMSHIYVISAC